MRVLGVDGCRKGWAVVALEDGRLADAWLAPSFAGLIDDAATVIGVDMPMGETTPGARACEREARRFLGARRSTIFTPPPLAAAVDDYEEAKQLALVLTGKRISRQAWHLLPKMLDVVPHWRDDPARIREVHPECAFSVMAGAPLAASKKTIQGAAQRRKLLGAQGIDVPTHGVRGAASEDVIDAAAVAWTAHRVATGFARSLPDPPERDPDGRPVAIWL